VNDPTVDGLNDPTVASVNAVFGCVRVGYTDGTL